ncbi:MAG: hypothetical protein ACM3IL_05695 [Deltaproteobacteria bacterium]
MRRLLAFLILSLIAGCASVSVQKYHKEVIYPKTSPASIVIFPEKPAGKAFTELGEITVTGANDWNQVERIFRDKAADMGADAVYVFNKQEETRQYVSPDDCYVHYGYYYPYHHFGWHRYRPHYYYPRGYYYCYGYQSIVETATFISAVGIAIKYTNPTPGERQ